MRTLTLTAVLALVATGAFAQEVVRSAVATLGLIAAVPLTTALAALTSSRARGPVMGTRSPSPSSPSS